MKKIAVLTTHRANNYGAMLQSYALTHKINQLGGDCEILDYRCECFEKLYHQLIAPPIGRTCVARFLRRCFRDWKTYQAFADFRKNNLTVSTEVYTDKAKLAVSESLYDIFIAGSDQIWNPANTTGSVQTFEKPYLLDFVKDSSKKYSYAASIGLSVVSDDLANVYKELLSDFQCLTLREHKGAELLRELLNKETKAVCDPVLLLTPEEWRNVEKPIPLKNKDYILVYNVSGGKFFEDYALALAEQRGCDVYFIQAPVVKCVSKNRKKVLTGVGPAEFIYLIRNARELVTNSFHGSAFGLMFGKRLHLKLDALNNPNQRNSRLESLFKFFDVRDEQIVISNAGDFQLSCITPNQENHEAVENSRRYSLNILTNMVL